MIFNLKQLFIIAVSSILSISLYANKHVLIIGLDGCRPDAFNLVYSNLKSQHIYPYFIDLIDNSLIASHLYAGGHNYDKTKQATVSEPGWTTILTGVWANQHQIIFNNSLEQGKFNHSFPTLFNYIKDYIPGSKVASFSDWYAIPILAFYNYAGNDAADINRLYGYTDLADLEKQHAQMTQDIKTQIENTEPPALIFVHFNNPDEYGHLYGFGAHIPEYTTAIENEDGHIDALMQSIKKSEENGDEWMVIITTDHGGHLHIHGAPIWDDKFIFATIYATRDSRYQSGILNFAAQGQTALVPTIIDYFHLPPEAYSKLYDTVIDTADKTPLYLSYKLTNTKPDDTPRVITEDWPVFKSYFDNLFAVTFYRNNQALIVLKNHLYVIYDFSTHQLDTNPHSLKEDWPGISPYLEKLVTFFYAKDKYYFFLNDGTFISYNLEQQPISSQPAALHIDWPGIENYANKINSVIYLTNDRYAFLLKDGNYFEYDLKNRVISKAVREINKNWNGLSNYSSQIITAFYLQQNDQEKIYFFLAPVPYH